VGRPGGRPRGCPPHRRGRAGQGRQPRPPALTDRLAHHKRSGEPPEVSLPERARRQSGARRWPS